MSLKPRNRLLMLDASVVINLLATERAWEIVTCQGMRPAVTPQVIAETRRCPVTKRPFDQVQHPLRTSPNVEVLSLSERELELFVELAAELGDGEAASIAVAKERALPLALDDRRARKLASSRYPDLELIWTTQLLNDPAVIATFPLDAAVFQKLARDRARMYVPEDLRDEA